MEDIHGQAILDFLRGDKSNPLWINNVYGEPEEMPVEVYFRSFEDFSPIEQKALEHCQGKTLDIGAAAGCHALHLQKKHDMYALELSPACAAVMRERGVKQVIEQDYRLHDQQYDTLLLLMNGIGIAGTLNEIPDFLEHCKKLTKPGGQVLFDSSDVKYLYEEDTSIEVPYPYYGDIRYQYEYKEKKGEWFDWVYADRDMLDQIVSDAGLVLEVLAEDDYDQYLGRITGF